ncbi:MAG: FKBP-type peptidyl-prolyl cis-trans isomerase [Spirochaetaceae bacterium]|jgi:FKBP-type peptidyl-prolyl cis-trans isomerase|nr:FKBP-type peptidyl-prolyl cis-trans isomerase [Spirochaetaceae bacterium]
MLKKTFFAIFMVTFAFFSCGAGKSDSGETTGPDIVQEKSETEAVDTDTSYAFGVVLGSDLKQFGINFDYAAMIQGIQAMVDGKEPRLSLEEAVGLVQTAYMAVLSRQAEESRQENDRFLAENSKKEGVSITTSGLQFEVVTQGQGRKPSAADVVTVNYEGKLIDGTVFDSSYTRGEPAEFSLDEVIPGWAEGIQLMNVGSTYRLYIPSSLAYGEQGAGNMIPPNSALIFQVELLSIK